MQKRLLPPISVIKKKLSSPSDEILLKWLNNPNALDKKVLEKLESSEFACKYRNDYLKLVDENEQNNQQEGIRNYKPPKHILELIKRRCAVSKESFQSIPEQGQIVILQNTDHGNRSFPFGISTSIPVVLNTSANGTDTWNGWLVASEVDYASVWDMVLDPEINTPLDPMIGMVQTWNPVQVYISSISKVIGKLKLKQLLTLRSLSQQYLASKKEVEDSISSQAGLIATRWINGHPLLTGTPLSGEDDPRYLYQQIFKDAAGLIAEEATLRNRQVLVSSSEDIKAWFNDWLNQLQSRLTYTNTAWSTSASVEFAMGDDDQNHLVIEEYLQISFNPQISEGVHLVDIWIHQKKPSNLIIEYLENDYLEHYADLSMEKPETHFLCNTAISSQLIIKDEDSNVLHSFSLKKE